MVRLERYAPAHAAHLRAFQLPVEQLPFTAHPADYAYSVEPQPPRLRVVVLEAGAVVGFFLLADGAYRDAYLRGHAPDAVALMALSVDARHQGRGVGTRALQALPGFVRAAYLSARRVLLIVNQRNDRARRLYARAGFVVVGERSGTSGPQWVMSRTVDAAPGARVQEAPRDP